MANGRNAGSFILVADRFSPVPCFSPGNGVSGFIHIAQGSRVAREKGWFRAGFCRYEALIHAFQWRIRAGAEKSI